jgi:acetylornithine deacetylase/succinyl-diaminopimelate desuccinylase-like protein
MQCTEVELQAPCRWRMMATRSGGMMTSGRLKVSFAWLVMMASGVALAQTPAAPDWTALEDEMMRHYQAVLRLDTSNPPGNEHLAVDYLKQVLEKEGILAEIVALDANRPNLVARLKGSGAKRPLLVMAHTDVVTVDAAKWTHPPFSATRDGGYVYARGAIDDKDNVTAALMTMLLLKRQRVPLDRDVIFLAESGEEGNSNFGIQFMVGQHFAAIDAEYCLAEGGGVTRIGGEPKFATVQATEKIPRGIELVAKGISGHGSVPLKSNAIVHLAAAVARVGAWRPEVRFNETTGTYFRRLAAISPPEAAAYYRDVLSADPARRAAADDWLFEHEPQHSSMLRTSVSPNIVAGGYRSNVIPSEARATLDVRMLPDEDPAAFLAQLTQVVADPAVEARFAAQNTRPAGAAARVDAEPFKAIEAANTRLYHVTTLPTMSTFATDMAQLRAKGVQCFGIGPATDLEDGPKGFGMHSDQERLRDTELYRFVRFNYEVIVDLARAR